MTTYEIRFSIFGSAAVPAWKRAVESSLRVEAANVEEARVLAVARLHGDADAIRSIGIAA